MIISSEAFLGWIFYRFSYKSRTSTQRVFRVLEKAWYARLYSLLFSCSVVSNSLRPHGLQHARPPCPSTSLGVNSNSCQLSRLCHPITSSSVDHIISQLQSFPASPSFSLNWLFATGGQRIGASASASVLPVNIQGWFPLGLTVLISFESKGLSRVFPQWFWIFIHII